MAFESYEDDLVADDGNGLSDIFVHDRQMSQTTRVSVMNTKGGFSMGQVQLETFKEATFPGDAGVDWAIQGTGDVHGDGTADILWRNRISGATAP